MDCETRFRWFEDAVQRHEGPLVRYAAHRIGPIKQAQQVVQETFLQLWAREPSELEGRLAVWLFAVCRNLALNIDTKEPGGMGSTGGPANDCADAKTNSNLAFELQVTADCVALALDQLSRNEEELIRLKFQDALSYREISEITNLSVSEVGHLMHTGIRSIYHRLAKVGGRQMSVDSGTPKLTAFILDELDEPESAEIARSLAAWPNLQQVMDDTCYVIEQLSNHFYAEPCPHLTVDQRRALTNAISGETVCGGDRAVSETFDPYHKWLAIPPQAQPADAYRLLGIQRFEENKDVIVNAADRQMAHIKSQATGPHAHDCQRILNELAEARQLLLDSRRKAEYDQWLQQQPPPRSSVIPPPAVPPPVGHHAANVFSPPPVIDRAAADSSGAIDQENVTSGRESQSHEELMPTVFDPYQMWLGIAPDEQPPNHYRLLGLPLFTVDFTKIERAANQQLEHIRAVQDPEHSLSAKHLLDEIMLAKSCLLDHQAKAVYDATLRYQLTDRQQSSPTLPATDSLSDQSKWQILSARPTVEPSTLDGNHVPETHAEDNQQNRARRFSLYQFGIGLAGILALMGLGLLWVNDRIPAIVKTILVRVGAPVVLIAIIVSVLLCLCLFWPLGQRWISKRWKWAELLIQETGKTKLRPKAWGDHIDPIPNEFPGPRPLKRPSELIREFADIWQISTHTPVAIAILSAVLIFIFMVLLLVIGNLG